MSVAPKDQGLRVPALEKGLDVLELLAQEKGGLLQKDVAARVGRSVSEIFRVLGALEARGYIARDPATGLYTLTLRLFELAHMHPPGRRLLEVSLPRMESLAEEIRCSCHLVTRHRDRLMIIAQAQPDSLLMGWSVKVGGVFPMTASYASARAIAAFEALAKRDNLIASMVEDDFGMDVIEAKLEAIRSTGFELSNSRIAPGVVDVSCPLLNHLNVSVAALTVSCVGGLVSNADLNEKIVPAARRVAASISAAIGGSPQPMPEQVG